MGVRRESTSQGLGREAAPPWIRNRSTALTGALPNGSAAKKSAQPPAPLRGATSYFQPHTGGSAFGLTTGYPPSALRAGFPSQRHRRSGGARDDSRW